MEGVERRGQVSGEFTVVVTRLRNPGNPVDLEGKGEEGVRDDLQLGRLGACRTHW